MVGVLQVVIDALESQPRHEDDNGSLAWAAWWLRDQLHTELTTRKEGKA
jgi:hypothetical protein